ncbi:MAG: hypothetical protein JO154_07525 [Chitinophaga sp.]|uniref:hypothetical protein n=1 Tax=Chitinophaga sp. TaxID=1869181 RepID=UPI0025BCEB8C|nr:hypothetical protein [Chitinophaga sp.]MBV8252442.1 hypothetical protein [Chitinophaga sp.]
MKAEILEIFELTNRIILIAEFEDGMFLRSGMHILTNDKSFKIVAVGAKRNLINHPQYRETLFERNIIDFDIAKFQDIYTYLSVGMAVDIVDR